MATKSVIPRVGVLAAIVLAAVVGGVVGRLVWQQRNARLADAFHLLTVGMERLNAADAAGAQEQFQKSIAEFRAVGRDPLIALHHAFAARLRTQAADSHEVRELVVPNARDGETLLALALSDDTNLLAVTTTHRLLCLRLDEAQWRQWDLPARIASAAALHVDSQTAQANLVVGDDGKVLSGDCRAPEAPLVSMSSASENQSAVAWFDAVKRVAWIASTHPTDSRIRIAARPLPGARAKPSEMRVAFPGEANTLFAKDAVVHAIAKIGDHLLLFYGDANLLDDSDLRDESVLVMSVDEPERQTNRLVFAASSQEEKSGKVHWSTTHVRRLLPASAPGRVYALTEGPNGVAVLGPDAKPIDVHHDSLFATEYRDGGEMYDLGVKSSGDVATMEIGLRGTETRLNYQLPWRFKKEPRLAVISSEGRRVAIANAAGEILLIDVSSDLAH